MESNQVAPWLSQVALCFFVCSPSALPTPELGPRLHSWGSPDICPEELYRSRKRLPDEEVERAAGKLRLLLTTNVYFISATSSCLRLGAINAARSME
jgi:hypothetical protein